MEQRISLVTLGVADLARAKAFYEQLGWRLDGDGGGGDFRLIQMTPPGSACSIAIGQGITDAEPGSVKGLQLVVDDIDAARDDLSGRGVEVGEVQDFPWGRFVFFADPDGNAWAVQDISGGTAG